MEVSLKRFRRYWSIRAKNSGKVNFATGRIETTMSIINPTLDIAMMPRYDVSSIDGVRQRYMSIRFIYHIDIFLFLL